MADDEPVSGVAITGLTPALGQQIFVLRAQHRESLDLLEMTVDAGFGRNNRPGDGAGHGQRLPLVSKRNYQWIFGCQVNFETLLYLANVSARNGRTPAARGAACPSRRLRGRTQPRPMDGAPLFCPRQLFLSNPVGVRGISSDDAWHRIASHQGA